MDADIAVIKSSKPADLPTAPGLTFLFAEDQKWKKSDITVTAVASLSSNLDAKPNNMPSRVGKVTIKAGWAAKSTELSGDVESATGPKNAANKTDMVDLDLDLDEPSTSETQIAAQDPAAPAAEEEGAADGERDSVVIRGHSFSANQPSRRSTIDIEPAIELEGDMAVEVTVEEQEGEGEGVDELTHDAPEVGGEAEATKGDRESVTIRGHSFNVNRPARRRSTTGVLGDSTDGATPEDRVVVRERRSSVGDIL